MTVLLANLPAELMLLLYRSLENIDDVYHLARSCRRLHDILEAGRNRLVIMRSVILNSEIHKYDVRLCRFIDVNQAHASAITEAADRTTGRPDSSVFKACYSTECRNISDEHVWEIVCRWQGLRLIQDLYLHPIIQQAYSDSMFPYDVHTLVDTLKLTEETPVPALKDCLISSKQRSFNSEQTGRFYAATTAHWLAIEALRLAHASTYHLSTERNTRYSQIHHMWKDNEEMSLQESFDVLEVYDFIYGYLLRKVMGTGNWYLQWSPGDVPYPRWSDMNLFVNNARLHLRPPDIIELLLMHTWTDEPGWPEDKGQYLASRGMFDFYGGSVRHMDTPFLPDTYFSGGHLEVGVGLKLEAYGGEELSRGWASYRKEWPVEARHSLFWWATSDEKIAERIREYRGREGFPDRVPGFPHLSRRALLEGEVEPYN
ncbi:MAG: hypothetical protein M1819_007153 [Sarea resinae]|nr:MAG: hypothetical protein M1819_007153 [Sarea resinae]